MQHGPCLIRSGFEVVNPNRWLPGIAMVDCGSPLVFTMWPASSRIFTDISLE